VYGTGTFGTPRDPFFDARFLWPDFDTLVVQKGGNSLLLLTVVHADLRELGFCRDGLDNVPRCFQTSIG
jgi:hypothetical protein